jgi:uncharacterized protein (TIRG00374 family)
MNIKETLKDQRIIKLVFSFLIILFLFKFINIPLLINSLKTVNPLFLIVLALLPVNLVLRAWRLMVILNKDEKLISLMNSLYLNLAGITLNLFMPASSGDIAKSYYGYKWHGIKEEMLSANIFDKFMALFGVFFIGTLTAILLKFYALSIFSASLSIFLAFIFFYPNKMPWGTLNRLISKVLEIELDESKLASSFTVSHQIKFKTFIISIFASLMMYLQFYFLFLSFSVNISFFYVLAVAPLLNLALLFPFTLNGLGSGEAMTIYLFSFLNISPTMSILVSLVSQLVNAVIPGLVGFLIIMKK